MRLAVPLAACVLVLTAAPARPQISMTQDTSRYEQLYGTPVDVTIDDLVGGGTPYLNRAVRTHGRLDMNMQSATGPGQRTYKLKGFLADILIAPMPEVVSEWQSEGLKLMGSDIEITGVFVETGSQNVQTGGPAYGIQFWSFVGPPEKESKGEIKAAQASLENLIRNPGARDGQTIRVIGKFRGRNLYGDLPVSSQRNTADWVIKDDVFAVWITGRKPKGNGWELDSGLKRDTGKWIEVIGRPETVRGITYIKVLRLTLTGPPTPTAQAQAPSPPPEKPKVPPVVVFALPLDGEAEVPPDSRFVVQFSKDMDEGTFAGHVRLRYSGPRLPGDREFDGLRLTYDRGRRALTVDPGDVLRPRRQVELLLLSGIIDIDGLALIARSGRMFTDAVDVLKFRTGT